MEIKISKGNTKIGKIPNISLVPIKDCGNCSLCKTKCYAMKAYRQYPSTRKAWETNSEAFRENPYDACMLVGEFFYKRKPKYFRIHVAGDFLNQIHLNAWIILCRVFSSINFMVNTKMFNLDYSKIPSNMKVRFSMWSNQPIPETTLPKAWLDDGTETRIPEDAVQCSGKCDECLVCYTTDKDVVFKIH